MMNLSSFPRNIYTPTRTPIEKAERLSRSLSGPDVFIKREDRLGLTEGGNKTRKLEFLIADAQAKGADTIITAGGIQSNHCRLTLAACVKEGLRCALILEENETVQYDTETTGNYLLYQLLDRDAVKVVSHGSDMEKEMEQAAEAEKKKGHTPYMIPIGGSNVTGMTGYAACAEEIVRQSNEMERPFDYVICASGSGGMHAGLIAGFSGMKEDIDVLGMNVSREKYEQEDIVYRHVQNTAAHIGVETEPSREAVTCFDDYLGPGYALPTNEMTEAVELTASAEAILLDPVYTGKAMAGLVDLVKQQYFKESDNVLFIHSGGIPALYAYAPVFFR